MLWDCLQCGTRYAESLASCPHCRSTGRRPDWLEEGEENGMPKISRTGLATGHADPQPDGEREHPGFGNPGEGTEHPADGTMWPAVANDGTPGEPVIDEGETGEGEADDADGDAGAELPAGDAPASAKRAPKPPPARKANGGGAS